MTDPADLIELDLEACMAARIDLALADPELLDRYWSG